LTDVAAFIKEDLLMMSGSASEVSTQASRRLFAHEALLPSGWASQVLLQWDERGQLTSVQTQAAPGDAPRAQGPVLPGMPNLHSHSFQRAMAGLTEYGHAAQDSFWSWRDLMYRFAAAITPDQLEAIATALYIEMLEAGFTSVCEFHYLHHDQQGRPYADDRELSLCLLRAAQRSGIGFTLLPVLYQTSDFGDRAPRSDQRRFIRRTDNMLALLEALKPACDSQCARLGLAPHSLRAVSADALQQVLLGLASLDPTAPIHLHIAEQIAEVEACMKWSGKRPLQWLLDHHAVDERWCLVHATHIDDQECQRAAASGAVVGLCPTTEANLGDGIFDARSWRALGGRWGIGSDSHIAVNAAEELLMLEYSQRLAAEKRNLLIGPHGSSVATSMTLEAVAGGAQASGRRVAGLAVGQQADWVILDTDHAALQGLPNAESMLSAHIFASSRRSAIAEVWVAGQARVRQGRHQDSIVARSAFQAARGQLMDTPRP
jgi:formimidoylglutamate deiminase